MFWLPKCSSLQLVCHIVYLLVTMLTLWHKCSSLQLVCHIVYLLVTMLTLWQKRKGSRDETNNNKGQFKPFISKWAQNTTGQEAISSQLPLGATCAQLWHRTAVQLKHVYPSVILSMRLLKFFKGEWIYLFFRGGNKLKHSKATPQNQPQNLYSISDVKNEHSLWGLNTGDKSTWSEHASFNHLSSPSHKQPDKQATHHTYLKPKPARLFQPIRKGGFKMTVLQLFRYYGSISNYKWKCLHVIFTLHYTLHTVEFLSL